MKMSYAPLLKHATCMTSGSDLHGQESSTPLLLSSIAPMRVAHGLLAAQYDAVPASSSVYVRDVRRSSDVVYSWSPLSAGDVT